MRRPHRASSMFTTTLMRQFEDCHRIRLSYRDSVDLGLPPAGQAQILASGFKHLHDLREMRLARVQHQACPWVWLAEAEADGKMLAEHARRAAPWWEMKSWLQPAQFPGGPVLMGYDHAPGRGQ